MGRWADGQTGRQVDRQTGRQADRQTGRQKDRMLKKVVKYIDTFAKLTHQIYP